MQKAVRFKSFDKEASPAKESTLNTCLRASIHPGVPDAVIPTRGAHRAYLAGVLALLPSGAQESAVQFEVVTKLGASQSLLALVVADHRHCHLADENESCYRWAALAYSFLVIYTTSFSSTSSTSTSFLSMHTSCIAFLYVFPNIYSVNYCFLHFFQPNASINVT